MRWLLLKDLQILRRSPLLVALLVIYPIVIAVLFGAGALRRPGEAEGGVRQPRAARRQPVPRRRSHARRDDYAGAAVRLDRPDQRHSREEAIAKVRVRRGAGRAGDPRGRDRAAAGMLGLGGGDAADGRGLLQRRGPGEAALRRVDDRGAAGRGQQGALGRRAARSRPATSTRSSRGGDVSLPLVGDINILGLGSAHAIIDGVARRAAAGLAAARARCEQVARFARLAADNLDVSKPILASIGRRCRSSRRSSTAARRRSTRSRWRSRSTVSLMFVTLLLAAGMLALEREEHAFGRLVRGLVSRSALLTEKIVLRGAVRVRGDAADAVRAGGCSSGSTGAASPRGCAALAGGALGFAAHGRGDRRASRARSGPRRCWRSCSRCRSRSSRWSRPGAVSPGALRRHQRRLRRVPVQADAAGARRRDQRRRATDCPIVHLLGLAVGFWVLARIALRRFG